MSCITEAFFPNFFQPAALIPNGEISGQVVFFPNAEGIGFIGGLEILFEVGWVTAKRQATVAE